MLKGDVKFLWPSFNLDGSPLLQITQQPIVSGSGICKNISVIRESQETCGQTICSEIACTIGPLAAKEFVLFRIESRLHESNIALLSSFNYKARWMDHLMNAHLRRFTIPIPISDLFQGESDQRAVTSSVRRVRLCIVLLEHQDRGVQLPNAFPLATAAVVARPINTGRRLSSLCSCHHTVQVSEGMGTKGLQDRQSKGLMRQTLRQA